MMKIAPFKPLISHPLSLKRVSTTYNYKHSVSPDLATRFGISRTDTAGFIAVASLALTTLIGVPLLNSHFNKKFQQEIQSLEGKNLNLKIKDTLSSRSVVYSTYKIFAVQSITRLNNDKDKTLSIIQALLDENKTVRKEAEKVIPSVQDSDLKAKLQSLALIQIRLVTEYPDKTEKLQLGQKASLLQDEILSDIYCTQH